MTLSIAAVCSAQSGRKIEPIKVPAPAEDSTKLEQPKENEPPVVTAQKREIYRCSDDGSLAKALTPDDEQTFTPKQVDTGAVILTRPAPQYTREARAKGVQGFVILRVVLSVDGKIGQIEVERGLPFGLTESAMRAACKIRFKPAIKDGREVSEKVLVEYTFRVSKPSIAFP